MAGKGKGKENKQAHTVMSSLCAHLPVEDNAPDEAQGQLVVSIHNVRTANVDQINLKVLTEWP